MLIKFRGEKGNGSKSPIWKQMHRAGSGKERWGRVRSESKGLFDNFQLCGQKGVRVVGLDY